MGIWEIMAYALMVFGMLGLALAVFLFLVFVGFRMGRQVTGRQAKPILGKEPPATSMLLEEDPFYRPMMGRDQPGYPTIKEGK